MLVVGVLGAAAGVHDDVDPAAAAHWPLDLRPPLLKQADAALATTPAGRLAVVPAGRRAAESGSRQQQEKAYKDRQGLIVEARAPPT